MNGCMQTRGGCISTAFRVPVCGPNYIHRCAEEDVPEEVCGVRDIFSQRIRRRGDAVRLRSAASFPRQRLAAPGGRMSSGCPASVAWSSRCPPSPTSPRRLARRRRRGGRRRRDRERGSGDRSFRAGRDRTIRPGERTAGGFGPKIRQDPWERWRLEGLAPQEIREMHADRAPPTVRRTCEHLSFLRLLFSSASSILPLSPLPPSRSATSPSLL